MAEAVVRSVPILQDKTCIITGGAGALGSGRGFPCVQQVHVKGEYLAAKHAVALIHAGG